MVGNAITKGVVHTVVAAAAARIGSDQLSFLFFSSSLGQGQKKKSKLLLLVPQL